jgi:hypothetical protein
VAYDDDDDDVNLLEDNIDTINKNTETLIDASNEVGLVAKVDRTKYRLVYRDQNAYQNQDIKIGNRLFENVSRVQLCGNDITDQNFVSGGD